MKILSYFYLGLVASLLTIIGQAAQAEDHLYDWTRSVGGTGADGDYDSIIANSNGDIYVVGPFSSTVDFDPSMAVDNYTSNGLTDFFLSKYDSSGNYQWTKTGGGTGTDNGKIVVTDEFGNIYISGDFSSTVDFDPGLEIDSYSSAGARDIYISKYDADGNYQWTKTMGGTGDEYVVGMNRYLSGNFYLTGSFSATADFDPGTGVDNHTSVGSYDIFIAKYDSNGNYQWTKTVGSAAGDNGVGIAVDSSGNVYATGNYLGTVDFDPSVFVDNHTSVGSYDIFIAKYDSSGNYQWTRTIGGTGSDGADSIAVDSTDSVFVLGPFQSTVDFDPGIGTENHTSLGDKDIYLTKYEGDGSYQWTKTVGGTGAERVGYSSLVIDNEGSIFLTGAFENIVDFNPEVEVDNHSSNGARDIFFSKYNTSGTYYWTKTFGGLSGEWWSSIALDHQNILIAGLFPSTVVDFDPSIRVDNHTNVGSNDIFFSKYVFDSSAPTLVTSGANLINITSLNYLVTATDSQATVVSIEYQADGTSDSWTSCSAQDGTFDELEESATCSLSGLSEGSHSIYFRTTDEANNTSSASSVALTVDTIPPSLPTQTAPTWGDRTDALTPTFSGTGDAAETIRVWLDHNLVGTATIDPSGNWTWTPSSNLSIGSHSIEFSVIDVAGNESPRTQSRTFQIVDDYDNDGLTTAEETAQGTDPHNADTDHDGSNDSEELANGTNPLDRGSVLPTREKTLCAEWNGFLGMWNVLEHVNTGSTKLNLASTLQDYSGAAQAPVPFSLKSGYQYDLLVHGMTGFQANRYGHICSTATNGQPGDLDGRLVFYKPDAATGGYQFALAMPLGTGLIGPQAVPYNTYQPSLDPADASHLAANWIQLTNRSTAKQTGDLVFYNQAGTEIAKQAVILKAGARFDYSAHDIAGLKQVGLVEWRPASSTAKFQLRNVRYYYRADGVTVPLGDDFESAFQLEGIVGNGQVLTVPLDTANSSSVLEIGNTLNEEVKAEVSLYAATGGTALHHQTYKLKPHATYHLIADAILNGSQGIATVQGNKPGSVIATAMQYGRTETLGIQTVYGIQASEPLGTTMRGSYNTYLKQGCRLLMANPTSAEAIATVSMKRYDGTTVERARELAVPAHGLTNYDLCAQEQENVYGVVTVQPHTPNTIFATVLRIGENEHYRFPTPVRE